MSKNLTLKEVAEHFCVTVQTVRIWVREGKLKANKGVRTYHVTPEQLEEFENNMNK